MAQVRELCVTAKRFAKSPTRAELMRSLEFLFNRLINNKIDGELWINGSFLTEAIDPKDVDLSLRISGPFYDAATPAQRSLIDSIPDLWDTDKIDGYLLFDWPPGDPAYPIGQNNLAAWKRQWGVSRSGVAKGIVVVKLTQGTP